MALQLTNTQLQAVPGANRPGNKVIRLNKELAQNTPVVPVSSTVFPVATIIEFYDIEPAQVQQDGGRNNNYFYAKVTRPNGTSRDQWISTGNFVRRHTALTDPSQAFVSPITKDSWTSMSVDALFTELKDKKLKVTAQVQDKTDWTSDGRQVPGTERTIIYSVFDYAE